MDGIGKTATAKAVYNLIHRKFDSSCFLLNVGATWKQYNGPVKLQKKLLSDILLEKKPSVEDSEHGIIQIKQRAWCRRVFLVLDGVDDGDQLKALAIDHESLCSGSRIIITTRDLSSISSLELPENEVYKPKELDAEESHKLFSWHAFKKNGPLEDYGMLSAEVVGYAKGIPLVLEILGSFFSDKIKSEWTSELKKLKEIPHNDVQAKLKLSYDSLNGEQKSLFLDIACFFVRMNKDLAIKILEGHGSFPESNIRVLVCHALLRIDLDNRLKMHAQIQHMGKEIVRQESSQEPGEHSRLWNEKGCF